MAAARPVLARALLQQCASARLQVKPPERGSEAEWVEIQRGLVIYICFFKGADEDLLPKIGYLLGPAERPGNAQAQVLWKMLRTDPGGFCFGLGGHSLSVMLNKVNMLLNVKLSENESGEYVSLLDLPGDVLIIPQATLGGKLKGRKMQYHANIEKEKGLELYSQLVSLCEKELAANAKCMKAGTLVKHGTYGNRQVLKLDTNGPYTHLIEF